VLEHHVGSPDNTPRGTPGNTSDADDRSNDADGSDADAGSGDAASAVDACGTVDYSICVTSLDNRGRGDCGDGESGEYG
jgi:hypothetical protein